MITIPTGDLLGTLSDAIAFAPKKKGALWSSIRIWWDGQQLHAEGFSGALWGRATWDPDDEAVEDYQPDVETKWGGYDEPWSVLVDLDDAVKIVQVYKLTGKKVYYVPLTIEPLHTALRVTRTKDTGHAAITTVAAAASGSWPKVDELMQLWQDRRSVPLNGLLINAELMAAFGDVRQRGYAKLKFTGEGDAVFVTIGNRFVGAIRPSKEPTRTAEAPAPPPRPVFAGEQQLPFGDGDDDA